MNCTKWSSYCGWFDERPKGERPGILFIQEHKLRGTEELQEASAFMNARGYTSIWTPTGKGPNGGPAGGTAVAAIAALGLRRVKGQVAGLDRLTAGIVRIPQLGDLTIASAYGWTGLGPRGKNLELLSAIPQLAGLTGLPTLVGGDFNLTPGQIAGTKFLKKASLEVLAPDRGTCVTGSWKGASTIDLFVATAGLATTLSAPQAIKGQKIATHRPVQMQLAPHNQPTYFWKLSTPPKLSPPTTHWTSTEGTDSLATSNSGTEQSLASSGNSGS